MNSPRSKLILALLASSLLASACGKAKEEEKKNPITPNAKLEPRIVDLNQCRGDQTENGNIMRNPWQDIRIATKNIIVWDTFLFRPTSLTKTTICSIGKTSVQATAIADISLSEKTNEIVITKGAKASAILTVSGTEYPCTAEILASSDPVKYAFAGECLVLKPDANSTINFPPASY